MNKVATTLIVLGLFALFYEGFIFNRSDLVEVGGPEAIVEDINPLSAMAVCAVIIIASGTAILLAVRTGALAGTKHERKKMKLCKNNHITTTLTGAATALALLFCFMPGAKADHVDVGLNIGGDEHYHHHHHRHYHHRHHDDHVIVEERTYVRP